MSVEAATPKTVVRVIADDAEKQNTRWLYRQAFNDPKKFIDYYYAEKCADNTMVVLERDGRLVSMLHLNPYTLFVCGKQAPSCYIVAVATDRKYRRQGYMAQVMRAAKEEMRAQGVAICFLLPVDEDIYTDFGFETVCPFRERGTPMSDLPYQEIQSSFDVYCVRDAIYERRKRMEDALAQKGATEVLPQNPVIMACVTDLEAAVRLFDLPNGAGEKDVLARMRGLRCYFCEEV